MGSDYVMCEHRTQLGGCSPVRIPVLEQLDPWLDLCWTLECSCFIVHSILVVVLGTFVDVVYIRGQRSQQITTGTHSSFLRCPSRSLLL